MWIMALACLRLDHSFFDILLVFWLCSPTSQTQMVQAKALNIGK